MSATAVMQWLAEADLVVMDILVQVRAGRLTMAMSILLLVLACKALGEMRCVLQRLRALRL